jgi:hypothetical protein
MPLAIGAGALVMVVALATSPRAEDPRDTTVSWIQSIATPATFDGKRISLVGYVVLEADHKRLTTTPSTRATRAMASRATRCGSTSRPRVRPSACDSASGTSSSRVGSTRGGAATRVVQWSDRADQPVRALASARLVTSRPCWHSGKETDQPRTVRRARRHRYTAYAARRPSVESIAITAAPLPIKALATIPASSMVALPRPEHGNGHATASDGRRADRYRSWALVVWPKDARGGGPCQPAAPHQMSAR